MSKKHVFVPFAKNANAQTAQWVKDKRAEWRITKDRGLKDASLNQPLAGVGNNDTIWVQAEGFTNNLNIIGSPQGAVTLSPAQLLIAMTNAGLNPNCTGVKIKIWACFSGFAFAQAFYNQVVVSYPHHFHGMIVDGYNGGTRLAQHKIVKPATLNAAGTQIHNWAGNNNPDVLAKSAVRVRCGPKP